MPIYIISDLHFNHKAILAFERNQFQTIEEHNQYIIDQWNKVVKKDDIVYLLGDVGFISKSQPLSELGRLTCQLNGHIYCILGNHDHFKEQDAKTLGFDKIYTHPIYYNDKIILSHEPVQEAFNNPYVINIHGHLHKTTLDNNILTNYFNVSAAFINYQPQLLSIYINKALTMCKKRHEDFQKEWYAKYYIF